jgi:peptide/nickel transport system permease protein
MAGSLLISSVPYLVFALLAWLYLVNKWTIFPETGYFPITDNPGKWLSGLILPWLVLALANMVNYARFSRGSMVETLGEDYIRTARAKGLSQNRSIFKHGLRASIVTVITIFGLDLAALLTGTLVTEQIFEIDGIGKFGFDAIKGALNFPVLSGVVLFSAILIVLANLLVDLFYTVLDPRVRLT